MPEASRLQAGESLQAVGVDGRPGSDVLLEEWRHRCRREVREDHHADPPRTVAARLNGHQDRDRAPVLQLAAPLDPRLGTTNPGVIDFDVPVEGLACRIDHRSAQLVEHHPSRFIAAQAELALEQERRNAALVGRHQIRGPEPVRSAGFSCCAESFRPSRTPGADSRHTANAASRLRTLAGVHSADTRNPLASDRPPDTAGRPPRSQIDAEIRANSSETAGAARAYTTNSGVLKQPDKQESL